MELKIDLQGLKNIEKMVSEEPYRKALGRTLNRTKTKFKSVTTKEVRKTYNIRAKDLKQYIQLKKTGNLEWKFMVKGKQLGLEKFKPRQNKSSVSVMVKKGQRFKLSYAFLAKDKNGNIRVFERETKKRMPIDRLFSLSVPQMFNEKILGKGFKEAEQTFEKEFKHNLDYYLGKMK